jgi:UDP-N-acetylglucosamine 2-epimerase
METQPKEKSNNSKIAIVVGNRPQFIKIALLVPELKKHFDVVLINTGQHYDYNMSGIFLDEFNLNPDYNLKSVNRLIMEKRLTKVLIKEKPNAVIVIGDTDTTLVGALASVKLGIKLIHIESGWRSGDKKMPEEVNRIIVDHLSDILFAPTKLAVKNLRKEGLKGYLVGDLQTDVQLYFINNSSSK